MPEPAKSPIAGSLERVECKSRAEWRRWLARHYQQRESIWLVTYKKSGSRPDLYVPYSDLVEEGLCFGWIDSRTARLDGDRTMLLFAPRKAGSVWSKVNKALVARLIANGRMTPAGLAKIEAAKRDGSWTSLDEVEALVIPPDLGRALAANKQAKVNWDKFPPSVRKRALSWIASAKQPATRERRISETMASVAQNQRPNPPKPRP